jgi:two-component system nitrogen regulation sensor histidine kinase NtrY
MTPSSASPTTPPTGIPSGDTAGVLSLWRRLMSWAVRTRLSAKFAVALAIASVAAGTLTYVQLSGGPLSQSPGAILMLLYLDLVLVLLLGAVVARRIVQLWTERRRGSAGAKLHARLVLLFSGLVALPAILITGFSAVFFDLGLQAWFSERVRSALKESLAVAELYLEEHRNTIRADILAMANDFVREGPLLRLDHRALSQLVAAQQALRALNEAVVFEPEGRVVAHAGLTMSLALEVIPNWALQRANDGELVIFEPEIDPSTGRSNRVRALLRLAALDGLYLMIGRFVDPQAVAHVERTRDAVSAYQHLEGRRSSFQITFAIVFIMVAILLLLAAVWVGLVFANRLVRPIGALIEASERVRSGDLNARVDEQRADDELAALSRAFNRMTSQLDGQRRELVEANRQLDERRRFTEAVLGGVSAGVIGLDAEGRINLPNPSASALLSVEFDRLVGTAFGGAVPEMAPLVDAVRANPHRHAQEEIAVTRDGRRRTFLVRVAAERIGEGAEGFVVTFDDITELETAQRKAAWADVARRIAHEIKNPLTPIQLSAERLKRRYLGEIRSDPETFRTCIETIVRQVGEIGRMVDEFSSFARMPAPVMREEDIVDVVRQTVFLQRQAHPEIAFTLEVPLAPLRIMIDSHQIGQAVTNLLQNALDAISGREPVAGRLPQGRVTVRVEELPDSVNVVVIDNGRGLPSENRDRLTEPYVTTRTKGTGLGLAIVKKIMEDHGGEIHLEENIDGGARVTLVIAASRRPA